ncbi:PACE efflux transporter [Kaistia sp. UC242_56]|uniref:PACE efflux transporter n=1 Tax=Kaistia sp. UC242_56 TaxID=3374625 RepID=UPI0037AED0D3
MQGVLRRVVYISTFEVTGILISALILAYLSGTAPSHTGPLAVMTSALAITVNLAYTSLFERWEASRPARSRSFGRRVLHALGFQVTLLVFLIPLMAWWMEMSLVEALILDTALIVFFPIYMFVFNWAFDGLFGLPDAVTKGFGEDAAEAA